MQARTTTRLPAQLAKNGDRAAAAGGRQVPSAESTNRHCPTDSYRGMARRAAGPERTSYPGCAELGVARPSHRRLRSLVILLAIRNPEVSGRRTAERTR